MNRNQMELTETDIAKHYTDVYHLLQEFSYSPKKKKTKTEKTITSDGNEITQYIRRNKRSIAGIQEHISPANAVEFVQSVNNVIPDDPLETEIQSHIIRTLRRGGAIAYEVCEIFGNQSKLNRLKEDNKYGRLSDSDRIEYGELLSAASVVTLWVMTSYVVYTLSNYMNEADNINITIEKPEEVLLDNPLIAIKSIIWELTDNIKTLAHDDVALVKIVKEYFSQLATELQIRLPGIKHLQVFDNNHFRVEKDDFSIEGFELQGKQVTAPKIEMVKVRPEDVVGNRIAKAQAVKLARMMPLYDFERKRNPILEVAGYPLGVMGDGVPGTGKTTLFQMICTLLSEYCEIIERPFVVTQFTADDISSYQGKTAQIAKEKIMQAFDPNVIGISLFDDVDQTTAHRSDDRASAGQQEVTAVLMETLAGAATIVRGNCSLLMFSNYPEKVDDALRQRAGMRWLIDGPKSLNDFIDLTKIFLRDKSSLSDGKHDYFATQGVDLAAANAATGFEEFNKPSDEKLYKIYEETVIAEGGVLDTIPKVGKYLHAIQKVEPRFTGRAVKNIFDAVKMRTADFDVPEEWLSNPDIFINQEYTYKVDMIKEFLKPASPEVILQEINRYADSEFRYADKSFKEEVNKAVRYAKVQEKAREIFDA